MKTWALIVLTAVVTAAGGPTAYANAAVSTESAWAAFSSLKEGNSNFATGKAQHPNQDQSRRDALVTGQSPSTIVLSCSDSRVPPELVFDKGLGEIFSVRTAGHVIDAHAIASIEYAVEHLGARLLVILGHESCGAVKATLTTKDGQSVGSPSLDRLIASIRPNVKNYTVENAGAGLDRPVRSHVSAVTRELIQKSHIIRELIDHGELVVAQGIYRLASGKVDFWFVGQPIILQMAEDSLKPLAQKAHKKKELEHGRSTASEHSETPHSSSSYSSSSGYSSRGH